MNTDTNTRSTGERSSSSGLYSDRSTSHTTGRVATLIAIVVIIIVAAVLIAFFTQEDPVVAALETPEGETLVLQESNLVPIRHYTRAMYADRSFGIDFDTLTEEEQAEEREVRANIAALMLSIEIEMYSLWAKEQGIDVTQEEEQNTQYEELLDRLPADSIVSEKTLKELARHYTLRDKIADREVEKIPEEGRAADLEVARSQLPEDLDPARVEEIEQELEQNLEQIVMRDLWSRLSSRYNLRYVGQDEETKSIDIAR